MKEVKLMPLNDDHDYTQNELDNHANQLNPETDEYWEARGFDERPDDWEDRLVD